MPDVFRTFISNPADTNQATVFTVPTADVANNVPVSTFIMKTVVSHNKAGSGNVDIKWFYNDGTTDYEINDIDVAHQATSITNGTFIFQAGDSFKIQADSADDAVVKVSVMEIKQQQ